MGRRKSVAQLERDLNYAKKKAAYKPPVREEGGTPRRRPKISVEYEVTSSLAAANTKFTLQASKEGVEFFGKGALKLGDPGTAPPPPRGFKPNRMMAMVADASPSIVRAKGSTRPYIRYGNGTRDSKVQYNYTAPITATSGTSLDSSVSAAVAAAKSKVGGAFGRIWFEPEDYPYSASGA